MQSQNKIYFPTLAVSQLTEVKQLRIKKVILLFYEVSNK